MKKKIILICFLLLWIQLAFAQILPQPSSKDTYSDENFSTSKGIYTIGAMFEYGKTMYEDSYYESQSNINLSMNFYEFISNNFCIGGIISYCASTYKYSSLDDFTSSSLYFGPSICKYFGNSRNKPFILFNTSFSLYNSSYFESEEPDIEIGFGVGYLILLSQHFALEPIIYYETFLSDDFGNTTKVAFNICLKHIYD